MTHVRLVHWNAAEAGERAARIREAGYVVSWTPLDATALRRMGKKPPAAVVIDLGRLPSHGRAVAVALREQRSTRTIPLIFVGGTPQKVALARKLLPDATYTTWGRIRSALGHAIAHPPEAPVVPPSRMADYAGKPLVVKLGIKQGATVALVSAPPGFEAVLGELPEGVMLRFDARAKTDLTLWFVRSRAELERRIVRMGKRAERGGLWIVWPKKTSALAKDLTQALVREIGMAKGLVDFKICAVDETWSALRFTHKR